MLKERICNQSLQVDDSLRNSELFCNSVMTPQRNAYTVMKYFTDFTLR